MGFVKRLLHRTQRLLPVLLGLAGCLTSGDEPAGQFVAFQSDFEGFMLWQSWKVADAEEALDSTHLRGSRYVYINQLPSSGSTEFPLGTIIVKTEPVGDDPHHWTVFGRAKRGGGYNSDGAKGWEWFGIIISNQGTPLIDWRGPVPPAFTNYVCELGEDEDTAVLDLGDCNSCHTAASSNDYVFSSVLSLESL